MTVLKDFLVERGLKKDFDSVIDRYIDYTDGRFVETVDHFYKSISELPPTQWAYKYPFLVVQNVFSDSTEYNLWNEVQLEFLDHLNSEFQMATPRRLKAVGSDPVDVMTRLMHALLDTVGMTDRFIVEMHKQFGKDSLQEYVTWRFEDNPMLMLASKLSRQHTAKHLLSDAFDWNWSEDGPIFWAAIVEFITDVGSSSDDSKDNDETLSKVADLLADL